MPLYVVRWPNLSCALVRADSPDAVLDILDEYADPSTVRIVPYDGPVFLGDQPIPLPQPFDDILMLRDIIQANQDRIDVSDAPRKTAERVRAQSTIPGRSRTASSRPSISSRRQPSFSASHISCVSAVRTALAFSRARLRLARATVSM